MTAADRALLAQVIGASERLAADARSIIQRRDLACDHSRLKLARVSLVTAHRDVLWAFVPDDAKAPAKPSNGEAVS